MVWFVFFFCFFSIFDFILLLCCVVTIVIIVFVTALQSMFYLSSVCLFHAMTFFFVDFCMITDVVITETPTVVCTVYPTQQTKKITYTHTIIHKWKHVNIVSFFCMIFTSFFLSHTQFYWCLNKKHYIGKNCLLTW